jgi:ferric iron reductase protein FhuF
VAEGHSTVAQALASAQPWWSSASNLRFRRPADPATWIDLSADDASSLVKAISARARWFGGIDERLAASSFVFAYTQTLVAPAIATLVTADLVPNLAARNVLVTFPKPDQGTLWLRSGAATTIGRTKPSSKGRVEVVASRPELILRMVEQVVDDHLSLLVDRVATAYGFSGRILRANVAYECCWGFRPFLSDAQFSHRAAQDARSFQTFARQLADAGEVIVEHGESEIRVRFERRNCCLARLIPGKTTCEGCSITRRRRRRLGLA